MRVIVAGSRDIETPDDVRDAICDSGFVPGEIVHGDAVGVDAIANTYAFDRGVDRVIFPANWIKYGKAAGPIRNRKMAQYADALVAIWDGRSTGTRNMIEEMRKLGKPVFLRLVDREDKR